MRASYTSFNERQRIMKEMVCSECGKPGKEICEECFDKSILSIPQLAKILDKAKAEKAKTAVPKYQIGQVVEWSGYGKDYSGAILDFEIDVDDKGEIWITYVVDGVGRYWECELELSK